VGDEADAGELQGGAVGMNSYFNMNTTNHARIVMCVHEWHLAALGRYGEVYQCWCGAEKLVVTTGEPPKEGLQWTTPPSAS
jgi:hypothetical protein